MTRRLLITRQPADCTELQTLLDPHDIVLWPYPVLRVEDVADLSGWRTVLQHVEVAAAEPWLMMASPRAPARFVQQCRERDTENLLDLPLAVIGDGTAAAAFAAGLEPALVGPGTGLGLAEAVTERLGASRSTVIFACGHDRRPELPDALGRAGFTVVPVVVYRMRATPSEDLPTLAPDLDGVIVTSPRAVSLYLAAVGGRPLPHAHWALGPTTQDAARALGVDCLTPDRPTMESLAEELCRT
jgi:uroporphyrinogen-III synthase